ncbi:amidohydrolase [Sphaerisporangium krabiense]|uniref:6-methylsalicylate decarboxylase n=1 Tax=Sphaerisporangium krabiense TaxID=763782 RepID=A0A7W8Z252_9ACTN|nr:amidohydrolase family protein [Sphaerisporangium krabiense]MBB5626052.1 putative TIM-barrel fold metal-dependent hydrolase [Sphaerisporangium krabiense]GII64857.1 amidohydrolase [Sphaerisporangium krabiense]
MTATRGRTTAGGHIDVHAHFAPPSTKEERVRAWQAMLGRGIYFPEPYEWSLERTLAHMDASGTAMQMLSNIPGTEPAVRASNDYGARLVADHPSRFGLLAALPTDDPAAAVREAERAREHLDADGFAVTANYNGVHLGDASLAPLWARLDDWGAVVFVHPDARRPPVLDHPAPLYEVAFETARTVFDMVFRRTFTRYPNITFVIAHCGGAFPALTGRLRLLGDEAWVPQGVTADEIDAQVSTLYVDTAGTAATQSLLPAVATVGVGHIVYGSDWGAPCTTEESAEADLRGLTQCGALSAEEADGVLRRAAELFPRAARRMTPAVQRTRPAVSPVGTADPSHGGHVAAGRPES